MPVKIIIGADIVPTKSNYEYFKNADIRKLIGNELQEKLKNADFTIFNLEVPLTDQNTPIDKCGPNLIAPTYTIQGLKAINPHFFTLANNHILDQGEQGLDSTLELLEKAGIRYAGAGKNLKEAAKPFIQEIDNIKIGIYCCTEHEFTIASGNYPGANPFEPLESLDHIVALKKVCDFVIVLYHGGKEHYRYPSPYLQKVCRKLVAKGADIVVCQHSHCIGAAEKWKDESGHIGTIVYGQGNFLFDNSERDFWQTSLLIELEISKTGNKLNAEVNYYPLRKYGERVRPAEGDDKEIILSEFQGRSREIKDSEKVAIYYKKYADTMLDSYLAAFSGKKSIMYRVINKLSGHRLNKWIMNCKYRKKQRLAVRNYIECEAHRELVLNGIKKERRL